MIIQKKEILAKLRKRAIQSSQFFHQSSKTLVPIGWLELLNAGDYGTFEWFLHQKSINIKAKSINGNFAHKILNLSFFADLFQLYIRFHFQQ
jgi:hypothetical protein